MKNKINLLISVFFRVLIAVIFTALIIFSAYYDDGNGNFSEEFYQDFNTRK